MQYVPVRGWRIGTPPKPPKAAVPAGVLFWEVVLGRSVVEKSIGEGRENLFWRKTLFPPFPNPIPPFPKTFVSGAVGGWGRCRFFP